MNLEIMALPVYLGSNSLYGDEKPFLGQISELDCSEEVASILPYGPSKASVEKSTSPSISDTEEEEEIFYDAEEDFFEDAIDDGTNLPLPPCPFTPLSTISTSGNSTVNESVEEEEGVDFSPFFRFLKALLPSDPHEEPSIEEEGIANAIDTAVQVTTKAGELVFKGLQNPTIRNYVLYTVASNVGNYLVASPATETILEQLGPLALPITAAALYGLSYTSLPDRIANRVGVSKESLVLGGAALVALQASSFVDPSYFANLPRIALTGAITTGLQAAVTHVTIDTDTPAEELVGNLATDNAIMGLAQAIIPGSGVLAAAIGYAGLYGKTVVDIATQVNNFKEALHTGDMADIAQSLALGSVENPSYLMSFALHQVGRFTRAGVRSMADYLDVVADSDKIRGAQEHFAKIYLNPDSTDEAKMSAKAHLIAIIKSEIRAKCTLSQRVAVNLVNQFDSSFDSALDSINIEELEKSILHLSLTNSEAKQDYTKDLMNIHIRCLVAFSALNVTNNTPLTHDEQARFINNVAGLVVNHYERINPDSLVVQAAALIVPTAAQMATNFLLPDSVHPEPTIDIPPSLPTPQPPASTNLIHRSMTFMMAFFVAFFKYINSKLTNSPYPIEEEVGQAMLNAILITSADASFDADSETATDDLPTTTPALETIRPLVM